MGLGLVSKARKEKQMASMKHNEEVRESVKLNLLLFFALIQFSDLIRHI